MSQPIFSLLKIFSTLFILLLHLTSSSVDKTVKKRDVLNTIGGNINWYSHYGKQDGHFSKH